MKRGGDALVRNGDKRPRLPTTFIGMRGRYLDAPPVGRMDLKGAMVYHSTPETMPWPADEDVVYSSFPILFRLTRRVAEHGGCSVVPDLTRVAVLYAHLQFHPNGTVKAVSSALMRHMAIAWVLATETVADGASPTKVYFGPMDNMATTPPVTLPEMPRKSIRNTANACKSVGHRDPHAKIVPHSKFVYGAPVCTTCYMHPARGSTKWFQIGALRYFDPAFVAGTWGRLEGVPLQFLLIGMACAVANDRLQALSIGQYIGLGELAYVNPYRCTFMRPIDATVAPTTLATLVADIAVWRAIKTLAKNKLPAMQSHPELWEARHELLYFGYADVDLGRARQCLYSPVDTDAIPYVFRAFPYGRGTFRVMVAEAYKVMRLLETTETAVELHPVAHTFRPPETATPVGLVGYKRRPDGVYHITNAERLTWGYLLYVLTTHTPVRVVLYGNVAEALQGAPDYDGSIAGGVFATLFTVRATAQTPTVQVRVVPRHFQVLGGSAADRERVAAEQTWIADTAKAAARVLDPEAEWTVRTSLPSHSVWSQFSPLLPLESESRIGAAPSTRKRRQRKPSSKRTKVSAETPSKFKSVEWISDSDEDIQMPTSSKASPAARTDSPTSSAPSSSTDSENTDSENTDSEGAAPASADGDKAEWTSLGSA